MLKTRQNKEDLVKKKPVAVLFVTGNNVQTNNLQEFFSGDLKQNCQQIILLVKKINYQAYIRT
jgi:hypothetical protein